jgi:hypothetical protein
MLGVKKVNLFSNIYWVDSTAIYGTLVDFYISELVIRKTLCIWKQWLTFPVLWDYYRDIVAYIVSVMSCYFWSVGMHMQLFQIVDMFCKQDCISLSYQKHHLLNNSNTYIIAIETKTKHICFCYIEPFLNHFSIKQ